MTDYAAVLADLKAKRTAIQQELVELDDAIRSMERLVARRNGAPQTAVTAKVTAVSAGTLTMPRAVTRFFSTYARHEKQTTRHVMEGVVAQGIKDRKSLRAHVYNTLDRLSQDKENGPFVHHKDGRWSLREWNLGE